MTLNPSQVTTKKAGKLIEVKGATKGRQGMGIGIATDCFFCVLTLRIPG